MPKESFAKNSDAIAANDYFSPVEFELQQANDSTTLS
jgi:hypothetical protein